MVVDQLGHCRRMKVAGAGIRGENLSVAWRPGEWSLILTYLLISKVLMLDHVLEYMHVGFLFLVIDIVVIWT